MLTISQIKKIIAPICKRYGVKAVYLFGSYARGEAGENSDVDIRIEPGDIDDLFKLSAFRQDLVESLQYEVDIVSKLPEDDVFRRELARDEVLLYAA